MIKAIEGVITKKEPTNLILKTTGGVSYGIAISLFCSAKLEKDQKVELNITQIIREDTNLLYGFLDANEQKMFETLIKLNGIGAATAMATCSTLAPTAFLAAITSGDAAAFQSVPGIGAKTARRIIAELSDAKISMDEKIPSYRHEAALALESLGFKRDKILQVLCKCDSQNTGDLVKEALKKLA